MEIDPVKAAKTAPSSLKTGNSKSVKNDRDRSPAITFIILPIINEVILKTRQNTNTTSTISKTFLI